MRRQWLIGVLALLLAGCGKVDLYTNLSEKEANDIMAALLVHQIPATRTQVKDVVTITVPIDQVVAAIDILRRQGLPRDQYTNLGTIFQKEGLISSPLEERVRYTYGLSQTLAEAINQIDGVLTARVIIVLPEQAAFGKTATISSASVLIRYLPGRGVEEAIPAIKMLVQKGVDGLSYDNISVSLFPLHEGPPMPMAPRSASGWPLLASILAGLLLLALGGCGYLFWRWRHDPRGGKHD